jgi:hypothetical protein
MFRHAAKLSEEEVKKPTQTEGASAMPAANLAVKNKTSDEAVTEADLKELIEKNLKWSQIIYEQNRKINNKLLWAAIASWIRTALILIPIILGILFLPSLLKGVWSQYSELLGSSDNTTTTEKTARFDSILKFFNLDPAKQEQLKAILK